MTPELTADSPVEASKQVPSTAGMTTKVVKGSMWTLGGSVAPLAVSFISTPFIIRFLGTESYGVLLLVGLIPTYFAFADFGMGVASTKFAAEAYGQGDEKKEAEIVWTATAIAAISALIVAIPIFLFSYRIVALLNVPEHLLAQASIALKITSGSFFLGILSSVLNSPMLARLRMDLNMLTSAIPKILLAVVTPFILYFGGGLVEAVSWAFIVTVGILAVVVFFSARLLPRLASITINGDLVRPLIKFGGAWFVAMVAAILLVNFEKIAISKLVSVKALAYYSVAFTFANMASMFSMAMLQSLVPAFAQLNTPGKQKEFERLAQSVVKINLIMLLPVIVGLFVVARPFFTLWAGEDFGENSSGPFYILLFGLFFNILAYIPHSTITAKGRTDIFAKLYWFEFLVFGLAAIILTVFFGIVGAATAWSMRVVIDAFVVIQIAKRISGVSFNMLAYFGSFLVGFAILLPPVLFSQLGGVFSVWLIPILLISFSGYLVFVWCRLIETEERTWIMRRLGYFGNA